MPDPPPPRVLNAYRKQRCLLVAAAIALTCLVMGIVAAIICGVIFTSNTRSDGVTYVHYYPITDDDIFAKSASGVESTATPVRPQDLFQGHKDWIPVWEAANRRAREHAQQGIAVDYLTAVIFYIDPQTPFARELNQAIREGRVLEDPSLRGLYLLLSRGLRLLRGTELRCYRGMYSGMNGLVASKVGASVCLGQFYITSLGGPAARRPANQSSLVLDTCYGVSLHNISTSTLQDVLVPPYERFTITRNEGNTHYLSSSGECSAAKCGTGTDGVNTCPVLQ